MDEPLRKPPGTPAGRGVRETRAGRLSDSTFGRRMRGESVYAEQIAASFAAEAKKYGLDRALPALNVASFRRPSGGGRQLGLFSEA